MKETLQGNKENITEGVVFLVVADNKILLQRRPNDSGDKFRNLLIIPGGHIEEGETAPTAFLREVKEEIGLDFEPTTLFLEREQEDDIFGKWKVFYHKFRHSLDK